MTGGGSDVDEDVLRPVRASVPDLFSRLIGDARVWVKAEIAVLKCRGETLIGALRLAMIFILVAVVLASVALIALAVGLILTLATLGGPGWATSLPPR